MNAIIMVVPMFPGYVACKVTVVTPTHISRKYPVRML
jgi:hypothetical protein